MELFLNLSVKFVELNYSIVFLFYKKWHNAFYIHTISWKTKMRVFFIVKKEQLNLVVFEFIKIKLKLFRNKQWGKEIENVKFKKT